jgi:hypothetical protein
MYDPDLCLVLNVYAKTERERERERERELWPKNNCVFLHNKVLNK